MGNVRQEHWEHIYETKTPDQVSWTQKEPRISLDLIHKAELPKDAPIVDIGGGDSLLVDFLLREGFTHITVLDISRAALEKAQARLGADAAKVHWVHSDVLDWKPAHPVALWHDRAAFHFLRTDDERNAYLKLMAQTLKGQAIIGTFSVKGPLKCSGLEIQQYDAASMRALVEQYGFKHLECVDDTHTTPFGTTQEFIFCRFQNMQP